MTLALGVLPPLGFLGVLSLAEFRLARDERRARIPEPDARRYVPKFRPGVREA
jgi:hypothetical protein